MTNSILSGARAVIFDVGNTLTTPDWERISQAVTEVCDRRFEDADLQRRITAILLAADSDPDFLNRLSANSIRTNWHFRLLFTDLGLVEQQVDQLAEALDRLHAERHLWARANLDAREVLEQLKGRGFRLGAISNSEDGRVEDLLRDTGLLPLMDVHLDSFLVGYTKPDPRIFQLATEKLGVSPTESAFVGDTYTQDIVGAQSAGLRAILYDPLALRSDEAAPIIRSLKELLL